MFIFHLFDDVSIYSWLGVLLGIIAVLVMHLPYRREYKYDKRGRKHGSWLSELYSYEYGPTYARFDYHGLRYLQRTLLKMARVVWAGVRGDLLKYFLKQIRGWLGF